MEVEKVCECPECAKREEEAKRQEEISLAVLIGFVPMLTLTVFSTLGLF